MGKLHELLAVEEDLKLKSKTVIDETLKMFREKHMYFIEQLVTFKPFAEGETDKVEGELAMVNSLSDRLAITLRPFEDFLDAGFQKEKTNTVASADVILKDGSVIAKGAPATSLLFLERELAKFQEVLGSIPVLEPGLFWKPAEGRKGDISVCFNTKIRTKKSTRAIVLYDATKEHPAQIEKVTEDIPCGEIQTFTYSSKFTNEKKEMIIARLDEIKQAVKQARMRANNVDVIKENVGHRMMNYVLNGVLE